MKKPKKWQLSYGRASIFVCVFCCCICWFPAKAFLGPAPIQISATADTIRKGDSATLTITNTVYVSGAWSYVLDDGSATGQVTHNVSSGATSSTVYVKPIANNTYTVTSYVDNTPSTNTTHTNFGFNRSVTIAVGPLPAAIAGMNRTIVSGQSVTIGAPPVIGSTYSWTSSPSGFTSTIANPSVAPTVTTSYTVFESNAGYAYHNVVEVQVQATPNTSDCLGSIPICGTSYVQEVAPRPSGTSTNGANNDFATGLFCTSVGEQPGTWYRFVPTNSGLLEFDIIPMNISDDYNFALFDHACGSLTAPLSYNYCNIAGVTGMRVGSVQSNICTCATISTSNPYPLYNEAVSVTTGHVYYLFVSNPSGTAIAGYTLDFRNSNAAVSDHAPITITSATLSADCPSSSPNFNVADLYFSKPVLITSISSANVTLTDANNYTYTVSTVTPLSSSTTGAYSTGFEVDFSSSVTNASGGAADPDNIMLSLSGFVRDGCGNIALPQTVPVTIQNTPP